MSYRMHDELNQSRLKYLFETVQAGSVRAAAARLNVAPSAVSRQIALLEDELAVPLIERHRRGVIPTEAGQLVLSHFKERRSQEDVLISHLDELQGLRRGHIVLAVGEGFVGDLMGNPMRDFALRYPRLTVAISVCGTNEIIRQVASDDAQIGLFFHASNEPKIKTVATMRQPLCAIVSAGHRLAKKGGTFRLKDLADYPLALPLESFGTRQVLHIVELRSRFRLAPVVTTDSIAVVKGFAASGLGITFLPAFAVTNEIERGSLVALPIDDPALKATTANMATRVGRQLSVAANHLLTHLRATMQAFRKVT